jgi:hypothetical protein
MPELPDLADRTPICVLRRWVQDIEWANFFSRIVCLFQRQNSNPRDAVSRWPMNCLVYFLNTHSFQANVALASGG